MQYGYDAIAEIVALPADELAGIPQPLQTGEYRTVSNDRVRAWLAHYYLGRGLAAGESVVARLILHPRGNPWVGLFLGMQFELRQDDRTVARGRVVQCWFGCADGIGVQAMTLAQFVSNVEPTLRQVFTRDRDPDGALVDDVHEPFQERVQSRGILASHAPYFSYEQVRAFAAAAQAAGDTGLYLYQWEFQTQLACYYFSLGSDEATEKFLDFYHWNTPPGGTAIFSATGRWGALSSGSAQHAVIGGSTEFVDHVYQELRTTEAEQVELFFGGYEAHLWLLDHQDCPWVPELLCHLYGLERANQYISLAEERAADE